MSMTVPTVKVEADTRCGYRIVNESDFDSDTMKLFDPGKADVQDPVADEAESISIDEMKAALADAGVKVSANAKDSTIEKKYRLLTA